MSPPLLELSDVRIDLAGRPVLQSVTLCSSGNRIGLLGQGRFVFQALAGAADVVGGSVRIRGVELDAARESSLFGVAEPWSARPNMTMRDGLVLSALLGGCSSHDAKRRADRVVEQLGIGQLARQKLVRRTKVEHYLAGLAEAALFEPEIVVVDWPIGVLDADGWARFGTALSRLIQQKTWLAWVPGPARLPVESAWIGALDQLLWIEDGFGVDVGATPSEQVRTLVVVDASLDQLPPGLDQGPSQLSTVQFLPGVFRPRSAFVVDLPRDEYGRPNTEAILAWCDHNGLALFRLEPLDHGF
jgi:putative ABC transport system ATP-binding protein